jgi:hypothetical protein
MPNFFESGEVRDDSLIEVEGLGNFNLFGLNSPLGAGSFIIFFMNATVFG